MKRVLNLMRRKRSVIFQMMVCVCSAMTVMAREGFCFYIYHQPELPDALRDEE